MRVGNNGADEGVRAADALACRLQRQGHGVCVAERLLGVGQLEGACGGQPGEVPVLRGGVIQVVVRKRHSRGRGRGQVARVFGNGSLVHGGDGLRQGTRRALGLVLAVM